MVRSVTQTQPIVETHKLELLGLLAGGIAHDFNTILTCIIGHAQLLEMRTSPDEEYLKDGLNHIVESANQARDLISQIVKFGRKTEHAKEPVFLDHVALDTAKMIRALLPSTITIKEEINCDPCTVFADKSQMQQVLLNLCVNAAHAMNTQGGTLKIKLDTARLSLKQCRFMGRVIPGKYVRLSVSDTGYGIAKENIPRIFDPYFTTKKIGEGSGIGLFVTRGIVDGHEGAVTVSSRPGRGTTFKIFIPYWEMEN
jgi:signal transduction histidine kinase